ncbi:MAG: hypothetical protein U5Q03_13655 [Bacteroidota bacterium]|nr:hypothetical protein [Bacteroidota bacterium]
MIYHPAEYNMVNENITYYTKPRQINNNKNTFKQLLNKNYIGASSMVIVKKSKLLKVKSFDDNSPAVQDYGALA